MVSGPVPTFRVLGIFSRDRPVTTRDAASDPLRAAAARVIESYGLVLFDLQFRRESTGWVLRVMIDRPWTPEAAAGRAGPRNRSPWTTAGALAGISARSWTSSRSCWAAWTRRTPWRCRRPGLDRPLRGEEDYRRFAGRLAKIVTTAPVDGQSHFAGRLAGVEDGAALVVQGRRTHRVPLAAIRRARLDVEF